MSDLLKLFIVGIYLLLVYKYYKNTVLLLLFTFALILILCNINKVTEGYGLFNDIYSPVILKV